ncbi:unnamed protein product [Lactuca saligna]|uniref:Homeobox domain-containing protein n=1 Tax=Lactuca saligna TaxID=75948 RepID=A0AA35Z9X8_LACSI|nr:unnamed protein product [Lactuca saligna]
MTNRKPRKPLRVHRYEGSSSGSKNVAMKSAREDETCKKKPAIDWFSAVDQFHKLSCSDLSQLIRDSGNGPIRYAKQNGSLFEIYIESLARYLPLHLISKLLLFKRDEQHLKYLLSGVRLLHGLHDIAYCHSKLRQLLFEDSSSSACAVDLIFSIIVFLSNFKQKLNPPSNNEVLYHSTLLASSLYLFKACISSQWHDITSVLLAHPKVDVFTGVAFPSVRVVINFLQAKLSAQHTDTYNADEVYSFSLHCEASLQFLHSLCQQKLFHECVFKNKDLCKEGGVLWLVQDIMKLPQCKDPHLMVVVSRLKSKILSIMLQLCEVERISFLDLAANTTEGLDLAKSTISEVLELLNIMFCGGVNGVSAYNPRGILQLNAMRVVELVSDDSNFQSYIISNFTEVLTRVFLVPHEEFLSSWCSSDSRAAEGDITLNYDSYSASGQVLGVMSRHTSHASKPVFITNSRASQTSYPFAHQKTSLLVKIVTNLICYAPHICKEEENDLFLNKFFQCLQKKRSNLPDGVAHGGAKRAAAATRNLSSLLIHAESSTISRYLNKDDVQLFTVFVMRLEKLCKESDIHQVKEVHNRPIPQRSTPDGCKRKVGSVAPRGVDETNIETIGSYLSNMQLKSASDGMKNVEEVPEEESLQLKKRKRNIMNDVQISMIENALRDEPNMQRRAASVQLWADKLSLHGSEIASSQLKNWLNNRKAKLARAAAKNTPGGGGWVTDDEPSSYGAADPTQQKDVTGSVLRRCVRLQNGQHVVLVDGKGEEIGKGIIHLAKGIWFDTKLQESGLCVVDVTYLKVDENTLLPNPCDATGTSFAEAQMTFGRKRILWDSTKLLFIHPLHN